MPFFSVLNGEAKLKYNNVNCLLCVIFLRPRTYANMYAMLNTTHSWLLAGSSKKGLKAHAARSFRFILRFVEDHVEHAKVHKGNFESKAFNNSLSAYFPHRFHYDGNEARNLE